ncbi:MAG: 3'-5' exonuclease [Burkholderiaceae bacterium]|nr:3'-5' exonuclease [Burkholderiaceae bacterium]
MPSLPPSAPIAVIDFETTGSSPGQGARATEIAAVLVADGRIVGQYQSLMRSGAWVPPFIEQLTGISNQMLATAPPSDRVMREVLDFTAGCPLVAHNAAFDRAFWLDEAQRCGRGDEAVGAPFACTVRLSRRLFPQAPNHRLGTLAAWHGLPDAGRAHRALADATTTAHLLALLQQELSQRLGSDSLADIDHGLLCRLQAWPVARVAAGWASRFSPGAAPSRRPR